MFAAERTWVFPEVSRPAALLWPWWRAWFVLQRRQKGGCVSSLPSPWCVNTSEFAVLKLNWVVVKTSIMGSSGVGRVSAASMVTAGCQTGKTWYGNLWNHPDLNHAEAAAPATFLQDCPVLEWTVPGTSFSSATWVQSWERLFKLTEMPLDLWQKVF